MMIYKAFKKVSSLFLRLSLLLLALACLLLMAVIFRLQQGPISLEPLRFIFERSIQKTLPDYKIKLNQPELLWGSLDAPLKVKARSIDIQSQTEHPFHLDIKTVNLTYSFNALLTSGLEPEEIEIKSPHFSFDAESLGQGKQETKQNQNEKLIKTLIHQILATKGQGSSLKSLKITKAEVLIDHLKGNQQWHLPSTDFTFRKTANKFELSFKISGHEQEHIFSFSTPDKFQTLDIHMDMPSLTNRWLDDIPDVLLMTLPSHFKEQVDFLRQNHVHFGLKLKGRYHRTKGIEFANLRFVLNKGILNFPALLSRPVTVQEGLIEGEVQQNQFVLKACQGVLESALFNIQGTGAWNPDTYQLSFKFNSLFEHITRPLVEHLWPVSLKPVPRKWVMKNIIQAIIPKTQMYMEGYLDFSNQNKIAGKLQDLQGSFNFKESILRYIDELPKADNLQGHGTFNRQDLKIQLSQGQSAGLNLKKGVINIHHLDIRDQTLDMILTINAPLERVLSFIDLPPLNLARKNGLNKMKCQGQTSTILDMAFPLETKIEPHEIKTRVSSHISDLSILKPVAALDINLNQGNFYLEIEEDHASFKGKGLLDKIAANITWEKDLAKNQMDLKVDTQLSFKQLKKLQLPSGIAFQGLAPLQIHYQENKDQQGVLNLEVDMTPIRLSCLNWVKAINHTGKLRAELLFEKEHLRKINKFLMTATPSLNIEATATFNPADQLSLKEVQLTHFKAGLNEFKGSLTKSSQNRYLVTVNGRLLDLEPFIKNTSDQEVQFPKETMDIKITFDQLRLNAEHRFFTNTLSFRLQDQQIQALQFKSYLKSSRCKEDLMYAFIESYPGHKRRFTFQTPAAGKLLKAFNMPVQVQGGFLQLYAFKNDMASNNPWRGKFRIQNFRVKNVPTLAKVLSYAFPTGLADLSSKGLFFQQVRSNFVLTPQKLFLSKGHMQGNSLGMTMRGNIGRGKNQELHLTGSVIPGYILNSGLSKIIPFLGEILTGGKHEGIFSVSYTIEGKRSDPQVFINPVSLLTPGFLRRLFDWGSDADEESEDDVEDVDSLSPNKTKDGMKK